MTKHSHFEDEGNVRGSRNEEPSAKDAIRRGLDEFEEEKAESEQDAAYEAADYPIEDMNYAESDGNLEAGAKYFTGLLKNLKGELVGIYYPRISMDHDGGFEVPELTTRNNNLKGAVLEKLAQKGYRQGIDQPFEWGGPQPLYDETLHSVTKFVRGETYGKSTKVTTTFLGTKPISTVSESNDSDQGRQVEYKLHGLPVLSEHYRQFTKTSEELMSQYRTQNNLSYDGRQLPEEDMAVIRELQKPREVESNY